MGKAIKRLFIALIIIVVLFAGAVWWLLSYIAPEEPLDLAYTSIDVKEKALGMVKQLKPELVLTEVEVNHLIKMNLDRDLVEHIRLEGARFELHGDQLLAHLNVLYKERIPARIEAEYRMEWQDPNIVLRPQLLSLKGIKLPLSLLESVVVPLELPAGDMVTVEQVQFGAKQIHVLFKLRLPGSE